MQKWQFAQVYFPNEGDGKQIVLMPEGNGVVETIQLSENGQDRQDEMEAHIAKMGLRGWELAGIQRAYYWFKRPIE